MSESMSGIISAYKFSSPNLLLSFPTTGFPRIPTLVPLGHLPSKWYVALPASELNLCVGSSAHRSADLRQVRQVIVGQQCSEGSESGWNMKKSDRSVFTSHVRLVNCLWQLKHLFFFRCNIEVGGSERFQHRKSVFVLVSIESPISCFH